MKSYGGLVTTRVLLGMHVYHSDFVHAQVIFVGVMEGGYFPCIVYHWAFWYSPKESELLRLLIS